MITLAHIYILVGAFFAAISVLSLIDKANPRRALNFLFWGMLAVSFLAGAYLGDLGNGVLALGLVIIATIGMGMDIGAVLGRPWLFALGAVWMAVHAVLLAVVARFLRAPVFYFAVASQANIGGAASAPVVASAFHPSLAPVGVLLAVLGYVLGTYGAWLCGQLMRLAAPG